jgi:hypothetical protein
VLGHLDPGCPGQLVGLAGDKRPERETGVEARAIELARRRKRAWGGRAHGDGGRAIHRAGRGQGRLASARSRQRGRRRHGRRGNCALGGAQAEFDVHRSARGGGRQRRYPVAEAVLDPLQHEAVGRHHSQGVAMVRAGERAYPGRELLRRQFPLERAQAFGPGVRRDGGRHGAWPGGRRERGVAGLRPRRAENGNGRRRRLGINPARRRPIGSHCSGRRHSYPQGSGNRRPRWQGG